MTIGYLLMTVVAQFLVPLYGIPPLLLAAFLAGWDNGMVFPQLMSKTLQGMHARMIGAASGVYSTLQEVANALGVTIIGVIFATVLSESSYIHAFVVSLLVISIGSTAQFLFALLFPKQA